MGDKLSRRKFLRDTGVVATAVSAGLAKARSAAAETKAADKITVGIVGTGGRGCHLMRTGLLRIDGCEIIALCDNYQPHLDGGKKFAQKADTYVDYRKMLERDDLDVVVVTVPLHLHAEVSIAAMQAGKNVFCEKTMAYSIEQAHQMAKTVRETGKTLQVGHQRHYDPSYQHAVKLARDEKVLGRINHFRAQWHRNNDWRRPVPEKDPGGRITDLERHLNWRLYHETSGGLMTELGSHQMDVCNWIFDSLPVAVTGMGGVDYWKDGREVWDNVQVVYEYLIEPDNAVFYVPDSRRHERAKDYGELSEPYQIRAIYSSICANAHDGASEEIMGDHGTFILREGKGLFFREGSAPTLDWGSRGEKEKLAGKIATVITSGESHDLSNVPQEDEGEPVSPEPIEKRVEQLQFESFFDCIRTDREPDCNVQIGLNATVCALTANKAIKEGRRIEIDKSLYNA